MNFLCQNDYWDHAVIVGDGSDQRLIEISVEARQILFLRLKREIYGRAQ